MRTACRSDLVHLPASLAVRSLLACVVTACAVACGSDYPVESRGPIARDVRVAAVLRDAASSTPAAFDEIRIVFRRASGAAALDTIVGFAPGASSATVKLSIPLSPNAPATGELLTLRLSCISATRDTVYRGGPAVVLLSVFTPSPPVTIVLWPTGGVPVDSIPVVVDTVHLAPFSISTLSGDGQTGLVGALLGSPLRARVVDRAGKVVPGVTVSWSVALGGGILNTPSSVTDSSGIATNGLRLGLLPGLNEVTAVTGGLTPAVFRLTALVSLP